jgi:hypothetical protein
MPKYGLVQKVAVKWGCTVLSSRLLSLNNAPLNDVLFMKICDFDYYLSVHVRRMNNTGVSF